MLPFLSSALNTAHLLVLSLSTYSVAKYITHGPFNMDATMENDEVEVMGDWAFMRGHYTLTLTPKASGWVAVMRMSRARR